MSRGETAGSHQPADVVVGAAAGLLAYDSDTFDEPDERITSLFEAGADDTD